MKEGEGGNSESCLQLELELLLTENKQLRAKVALLMHEKQAALAMWQEERRKNQTLLQRYHLEEKKRKERRRDQGDLVLEEAREEERKAVCQEEEEEEEEEETDRCLPTSSGRSALQVRETSPAGRPPRKHSEKEKVKDKLSVRANKELFPAAEELELSVKPIHPMRSEEHQHLHHHHHHREHEPRKRVASPPISPPKKKKQRLVESRIPTSPFAAREIKGKTGSLEIHTSHHTSPTSSGSSPSSTDGSPEAQTGPKDYSCRDCKRKFCRRGVRDNHELLCRHTKWATGKTLELGFVE